MKKIWNNLGYIFMLKNLFVILAIAILPLNGADPELINQLPYVVFRDQGSNAYMQDRSCAKIKADHAFFGIFDGHGTHAEGHLIPEFLSRNFYQHVISIDSMTTAFSQIEEQMADELGEDVLQKQGSTASVILIKDNQMTVGHVGDSKIVLYKKDKVVELTQDHTPSPYSRTGEYARIKQLAIENDLNEKDVIVKINDKFCVNYGQKTGISMTRSFGDRIALPYVICQPDIVTIDITSEDELLVLATDGLWDAIDPWQAAKIINTEEGNFKDKGKALFDAAMERWATSDNGSDNIEIVVVDLKQLYKQLFKQEQELEKLNQQLAEFHMKDQKQNIDEQE
jgi:serine/threonine protein phosphatase PrpC